MAHFELEGQKVELAEDWRIGELIRAENALDLDMDTAKGGGKLALVVYISMARLDEWKPGAPGNRTLADTVMRMEITELGADVEDDAVPPAVDPVGQENGGGAKGSATEVLPTGGRPRSEASA